MSRDAGARMDRIYRHQRHIYDLSRKFYLLGRDRLILALALEPGASICEIGCGTGRNLVALARRYPQARIYGIDASAEMLKTARRRIAREALEDRARLALCLAEELDPSAAFGLAEPFDAVMFSYTLSMIPSWESALEQAVKLLKPDGLLAVVDFSGQRRLPSWFRLLLRRWLALFEVRPQAALPGYLERLAARDRGKLTIDSIYRDYAFILSYRKPLAV